MINKLKSFFVTREKIRENTRNLMVKNTGDKEIEKDSTEEPLFSKFSDFENRKVLNKWERITGKSNVIISFVSDPKGSTFYSSRVSSLVNTINNLGYDYIIVHYDSDRNYHENCCYKPLFIKNLLEKTQKNLIWIDGDTNLKKNIDPFINEDKDFDLGLVTYNNSVTGFLASPLFLRCTETTKDLLKDWSNHCRKEIESGRCELDHDALKHTILPLYKDRIRICLNWNKENDLHNGSILENVDSKVPSKGEIIRKITEINKLRPFVLTNQDFKIV